MQRLVAIVVITIQVVWSCYNISCTAFPACTGPLFLFLLRGPSCPGRLLLVKALLKQVPRSPCAWAKYVKMANSYKKCTVVGGPAVPEIWAVANVNIPVACRSIVGVFYCTWQVPGQDVDGKMHRSCRKWILERAKRNRISSRHVNTEE